MVPPAPTWASAGKAELGIDDRGAAGNGLQGFRQSREALGPVVPIPAVEANCAAFLDYLQAVAIELGLVQPGVAGGHGLGAGRIARWDEAEGHAHDPVTQKRDAPISRDSVSADAQHHPSRLFRRRART